MSAVTAFHADIKNILEQARGKARSAVNAAMVEAYWLIGQRIVQEEQQGESRANYGERLLENLSKALSASFGKGFSYANLRNFRQFYLTYPDQAICYTVCSKLSWSHILHARLINVLSHGNYSLFEPREMLEENKQYFKKILNDFMANYRFNPELFPALDEVGA